MSWIELLKTVRSAENFIQPSQKHFHDREIITMKTLMAWKYGEMYAPHGYQILYKLLTGTKTPAIAKCGWA